MNQLALVAIALVSAGQGQQGKTLADFVQSLQWDAAKRGPLMVLEPEQVNAKTKLDGLAAFGRTRTSMTGLSAVVPDTMVLIDDSMQQSPNLYDGLPRSSKVLYLLTTLSDGQWRQITGGGIGVGDLNKDQQAVFQSLLPKPFKLSDYSVNDNGQMDQVTHNRELSGSDRESMRLHVERSLQFMMPIVGSQGMTPRDTNNDYGKPGSHGIQRDSTDDFHKQDSFGMNIRQTVPNQLKPSDLDYRSTSLGGTISLEPSEEISEILSRIGQKTGMEFHADLRVADRKMVSIGQSAPIVSVLKTIALSVTGTYRRVGPAFILTSDLTGMGTRQIRLAAYDEDLNKKVWNQEQKWREQVFKSGHMKDIKFRDGDDLAPDDQLAKKMDQGWDIKITNGDLNEALRGFVQRQNDIYKTQQVTADGAVVNSQIDYCFVTPNGEMTRAEFQSLGQASGFAIRNQQGAKQQELPQFPKLNLADLTLPISVCLTAGSPDAAEHAVAYAKKYGLKDLWLDTLSTEALQTALKAASGSTVNVSLVVRPFEFRGAEDAASADRTLYGDTPPESYQRRMAETDTMDLQERKNRAPEPVGCISPLSSGFRSRIGRVLSLAKTPGLAGIRIVGSTPNGYNGPRVNYVSFPAPIFLEMGNFGYAPDLRLAFIREQSIDPIDLCASNIHTNADLRQPFFLDDHLRGGTSVYDGTDAPNPAIETMMDTFDIWLSKQNRSALQSLLDGIVKANPHVNLMVEAIPLKLNAVNRGGGGLKPWKPGDQLPEIAERTNQGGGQPEPFYQRALISDQNLELYAAQIGYAGKLDKKSQVAAGIAGFMVDLGMLSAAQADRFLDLAFAVAK